ncbi:MBL fold metallo-hydrolase [Virgibacillus oceani]|uniref:Metallo-beta-lactamase domain-containing protein n=1 Tax=Virgibacillus oceani TaxID=1479511 RepID=A0A917HRF3_9BACI|nr:MBL fold metallo-hydrolase [Virgibacillus oceani]GGG86697.1 hypothetical protein GCM10011398_35670 [Virgibacillus oceani]
MEKFFEKVAENVYAFLLWDDSWHSFNNCYVVIEKNGVTLIDSGKTEHFTHLESSLSEIGIRIWDITKLIATHGHKDHIGGYANLHNTKKVIHPNDLALLPSDARSIFNPDLDQVGNEFEWVHLGHHTKGSIALYHCKSKVLFCGDHVCFFGEPLPNDQIVTEKEIINDHVQSFLAGFASNKEMREKEDFKGLMEGLKELLRFDAKFLCTGHGVIVQGDIRDWINEILRNIK